MFFDHETHALELNNKTVSSSFAATFLSVLLLLAPVCGRITRLSMWLLKCHEIVRKVYRNKAKITFKGINLRQTDL